MKINWKVRVANKMFWVAIIPAVLLLAKCVMAAVGIEFDMTKISDKLIAVVESLFAVLVILGVVNDPTTKGASDSEQAMGYEVPKE